MSAAVPAIPPLESGDRLTRAEFERRYEAMPHLKKQSYWMEPSPFRAIDWFVLRGDHFEPLPTAAVLKSEVFPGLWLDTEALIAGDMARVFKVAEEGLAQPEHAAFVAKLQQHKHN